MKKLILLAPLAASLSGCAMFLNDGAAVNVNTYPNGAIIIDSVSGKRIGTAPMTVHWQSYEITQNGAKPDGTPCWKLAPIEARWPSGSLKQVSFTYCGDRSQWISGQIERDLSDPGLHIDLAHEQQLEMARIQQQRLNNERSMAQTLQQIESNTNPYPYIRPLY